MGNRDNANELCLYREDNGEWKATKSRSPVSQILDPSRKLFRG